MDLETFKASLQGEAAPEGTSKAVAALWQAANGKWDLAHEMAQSQDDKAGAWVHAYLHRVEGDLKNAGYWYRRAERPEVTMPLEQEWDEIAATLL